MSKVAEQWNDVQAWQSSCRLDPISRKEDVLLDRWKNAIANPADFVKDGVVFPLSVQGAEESPLILKECPIIPTRHRAIRNDVRLQHWAYHLTPRATPFKRPGQWARGIHGSSKQHALSFVDANQQKARDNACVSSAFINLKKRGAHLTPQGRTPAAVDAEVRQAASTTTVTCLRSRCR